MPEQNRFLSDTQQYTHTLRVSYRSFVKDAN